MAIETPSVTPQKNTEYAALREQLQASGVVAYTYTDAFLAYYEKTNPDDYRALKEELESSNDDRAPFNDALADLNASLTRYDNEDSKEAHQRMEDLKVAQKLADLRLAQEVVPSIKAAFPDAKIKVKEGNVNATLFDFHDIRDLTLTKNGNGPWLLDGSPINAYEDLNSALADADMVLKMIGGSDDDDPWEHPDLIEEGHRDAPYYCVGNLILFAASNGLNTMYPAKGDPDRIAELLNGRYNEYRNALKVQEVQTKEVPIQTIADGYTGAGVYKGASKGVKFTFKGRWKEGAVYDGELTYSGYPPFKIKKPDERAQEGNKTFVTLSGKRYALTIAPNTMDLTWIPSPRFTSPEEFRKSEACDTSKSDVSRLKDGYAWDDEEDLGNCAWHKVEAGEQAPAEPAVQKAPVVEPTAPAEMTRAAGEAAFVNKLDYDGWSHYVETEDHIGEGKMTIKLPSNPNDPDYKYSRIHHFLGKNSKAIPLENPEEYTVTVNGKPVAWQATGEYPDGTWVDSESGKRVPVVNGTTVEWHKKEVPLVAQAPVAEQVAPVVADAVVPPAPAPAQPEAPRAPEGTDDEGTLRGAVVELANANAYVEKATGEIRHLEEKKGQLFANDKKLDAQIAQLNVNIAEAKNTAASSLALLQKNRGTEAYVAALSGEDPERLAQLGIEEDGAPAPQVTGDTIDTSKIG